VKTIDRGGAKSKTATDGAKRSSEAEPQTEITLPRHLRREFRLSVELAKGIVLAYEANAMTKPWWMLESRMTSPSAWTARQPPR
jgi:hypothetical protein